MRTVFSLYNFIPQVKRTHGPWIQLSWYSHLETAPSVANTLLNWLTVSLVTQRVIYLRCRRPWFDPWVGKIPWKGKELPTLQCSCLEESMDRGASGLLMESQSGICQREGGVLRYVLNWVQDFMRLHISFQLKKKKKLNKSFNNLKKKKKSFPGWRGNPYKHDREGKRNNNF